MLTGREGGGGDDVVNEGNYHTQRLPQMHLPKGNHKLVLADPFIHGTTPVYTTLHTVALCRSELG